MFRNVPKFEFEFRRSSQSKNDIDDLEKKLMSAPKIGMEEEDDDDDDDDASEEEEEEEEEKKIEIDITWCLETLGFMLYQIRMKAREFIIQRHATAGRRRKNVSERKSSDSMKTYYVESKRKMKRKKRIMLMRVFACAVWFWVLFYAANLYWSRRTAADDFVQNGARKVESRSIKEARKEVEAAKRGQILHTSGMMRTRFSGGGLGGIYPSRERVDSPEYEKETSRLMDILANRIANGQHHSSSDFNDVRKHVREHRMRAGTMSDEKLVHIDNAEVMRLRQVKKDLRDDFLRMGPSCKFDESGLSREGARDLREECHDFFREEKKRMDKIPLLDDAKFRREAEREQNRNRFPGHRLPTDIRQFDMPH